MIVVVSDLHLQHTSLDGVRREEGGQVFETRVSRNVGAGALALLFSEIVENAQRCNAGEVHLVFAGDIFELHRTPLWFAGGEPLRPTLHPASSSAALERRALEILSAVERDNREFFRALAAFVGSRELVRGGESRRLSVPLIPHYIPGNHDRLIRCWPSTRQRARELLCIPGGDGGLAARFPHRLEWPRRAGYGVRPMDEKSEGIRWTRTGPPPSTTVTPANKPRRAPKLTKLKNVALFSDLFSSEQRVNSRHVKGVQVLYGHGGAKWVDRTIVGPTGVPFNNDLLVSKEPFSAGQNAAQQRMWQALDKQ